MTIIMRSTWHVASATYQDVYVICRVCIRMPCSVERSTHSKHLMDLVLCESPKNFVDNYIQFGEI